MRLVYDRYLELVESGQITKDSTQLAMVARYDALLVKLLDKARGGRRRFSWFSFGNKPPALQGIYSYGAVGRGKTMLMDLFYACLPITEKRRAHFNDFMADVHNRIAHFRAQEKQGKDQGDALEAVAKSIAKESWVLCFDEFTVTDIADAMILGRLFSSLFRRGVILIATSNVAPQDLYKDGLNRGLFLPFIKVLHHYVEAINLDVECDYRLEKARTRKTYFTPLGPVALEGMDHAWAQLTKDKGKEEKRSYTHKGHVLVIPRAVGKSARFDFLDLCQKPFSAADYAALFENYTTVFVDNVPCFEDEDRNAAKRFILLIDVLYDQKKQLFISAQEQPDRLYQGRAQTTEKFEFERTASRLFEMQSQEYLR